MVLRSGEPTGRTLWRRRVTESPERVFVHQEGQEWTYGDFDDRVRRLARGLRELGVAPASRVLVAMGNRPETLQVELAVQELGAVFVPLLPGLTFDELSYPINHSEARFLVADGAGAGPILEHRAECPALAHMVVTADAGDAPSGIPRLEELAAGGPVAPSALADYDEDVLAAILYTSGSTGRPKGVMLRAGSFYSVGEAFADRFGVTAQDTYFLPTTLAHAVGSLTALSMTAHTGSRLAIVERFRPSTFWSELAEARGTYSILFPAHLNLLLETAVDAPPSGAHTLRLVITHAYIGRFAERFGVELATVWGMTETGALCVGSEPGYGGELGDNYVGTPMLGVEAGVFDDRMQPLPPGRPGEIALRHRHVMLGYLKDPEATAKTLVDGWVRSGDLGVLDDEGRLFFVGRMKNVIKRSGENISAEEVENALADLPEVAEATVFAIPDRIRTEEVAAVLVCRPGSTPEPAGLRDALRRRLVRWKLPRYLVVRHEVLPRLPNGKLDRIALRESLTGEPMWDAEVAARDPVTPADQDGS